ncbi:MAG: ribbon-helix-helix protein, CopG family [Eubacteriales bacterium]|nr:ribbon-helix-helix protein, CopG family [Eubacteriales bacterium]
MSNRKKIITSLPESLLEQVDSIVKEDHKNRSELIREALVLYLTDRRKKQIRREMVEGYQKMGDLNQSLSEDGIGADLADLKQYELNLK